MAVGADDFALLHLLKNGLPGSVGKDLTDAEELGVTIEVIKLENYGVGLAAVDTGVVPKERDQFLGSLEPDLPL